MSNVTLVPCAVGDRDSELTFYAAPNHFDISSAYTASPHAEARAASTVVPCRTLDSLTLDGVLPAPALMKIDVEGHKFRTLTGARQMLARERPALAFEYNYTLTPQAGWTPNQAADPLRQSVPYELKTLNEDGSLHAFPPPAQSYSFINLYADCKTL